MSYQKACCRTVVAIIFCLTAPFTAFAADTEDQTPVIIMDTFDVHAKAGDFFKLIDRAIKLAKEADPGGGGQIHILAGHSDPKSASQVIIFTTFPSMDAYISNEDALKNNPKMQAIFEEMQAAKFEFTQRTVNTLVAEY